MRRLMTLFSAAALLAGSLSAGEKKMMHCFAFTVIDTATPAEWEAFEKATDALPDKIPGIGKVWHGKLRGPLAVFNPDTETRKKIKPETTEVEGKFTRLRRQHGVCMEMSGEGTLKSYADHPYHKEWTDAYAKVRVAGTTTFDILGK
ncbi:MAG: hypothetical protein HYR60_03780 [Acidobacteria bacterium]|nr:hypothetical protein [Acidobacteriota bacterium]